MIYGYARVSSRSQLDNNSLEQQEQEIKSRYTDAIMYKEQFTGTTIHRPVFQSVKDKLKAGDVLAVTRLDRLARNTVEGLDLVEELFARGVAVHVFNVGLLEKTPMGEFFITLMLAVAALERNNIIERTQNGKAIARQRSDYREGRKPGVYDEFEKYQKMKKDGLITVVDACAEMGISRSQWYKLEKQSNPPSSKSTDCPVRPTLARSIDTAIVSCPV